MKDKIRHLFVAMWPKTSDCAPFLVGFEGAGGGDRSGAAAEEEKEIKVEGRYSERTSKGEVNIRKQPYDH